MRLTDEEKAVRREIEDWQHADASVASQAMDWAMRPVDWAVEQVVPAEQMDQVADRIEQFLSTLSDASEWTHASDDILAAAEDRGLPAESVQDLRNRPVADLDALARSRFRQNTLLAALEGGGTGLAGAAFVAADIPLLFTINLRLIQQIAASYGFSLEGPMFRPLVLSIFNVAASGGREARNEALREVSVAAAAFADDLDYAGRVSGTFRDQNRHVPREIAKTLLERKLGQTVPLAGAAVGAGVNYWFTTQTAESAFMCTRALYLDWKERR
ncbi:EcsC family protein [Salinibacter grassmerensis]|uniref:EcsC family protein n=1 Tax=Salinibacter grassmerensis TaxID=3040353 RepID=UPI0021E8BC13|nr:EcsC family protein [Salinibacter grassmerensis]